MTKALDKDQIELVVGIMVGAVLDRVLDARIAKDLSLDRDESWERAKEECPDSVVTEVLTHAVALLAYNLSTLTDHAMDLPSPVSKVLEFGDLGKTLNEWGAEWIAGTRGYNGKTGIDQVPDGDAIAKRWARAFFESC